MRQRKEKESEARFHQNGIRSEHFQAKWITVRRQKMRPRKEKESEARFH